MYVFIINSLGFGGAETALIRILRVLKHRNISFTLIVQRKVTPEMSINDLAENVLYLSKIRFSFIAFVLNIVKAYQVVIHLRKRMNYKEEDNKIIAFLPQSVILGYIYSKILGCELIPVEQNNIVLSLKSGLQNSLFRFFLFRIYRRVGRNIVTSNEISIQMKSVYNFKGEVNYIPNCVEVHDSQIIKPLSIKPLKIVMVGRLVDQKNYPFAIEVFNKLKQSAFDFEVHIYGEGPERNRLFTLLKRYDLVNEVKLLGSKENVVDLLGNYSFFMHTANYEGFGNVLIEAMSKGLVVISMDVDFGPREIITNGHNGYLLSRDVEKWVSFFYNFRLDDSFSDKLRYNAFSRSKEFSSEVIADKYLTVIGSDI